MTTSDSWPTKHGLRIGFLNINSLPNKIEELSYLVSNSGLPFHIFCCAESHLNENISDEQISISGYNHVRLDPHQKKQTGLIVYISKTMTFKQLTSLEKHNVETIWLEISLKKTKPLVLAFIYRHPDEPVNWYERFNNMMETAPLAEREIILFGDFNINLLKKHLNWEDTYKNLGLTQLIDTPTRLAARTLIDHIYVNNTQNIIETCVPHSGCSDHLPLCLTWLRKGTTIPKPGHKVITYRSFTKFDEDLFLADLVQSPFSLVYQHTDPDEAFELWHRIFINVYNKHAPIVTKRVKYSPKPPWYNNDVKEESFKRDTMLKEINKLKQKLKKKKEETQDKNTQIEEEILISKKWDDYKKQRNKVTSIQRQAKKVYFQNLISSSTKKDSKSIWKAINMLTNKSHNKIYTSCEQLSADNLNKHFSNVSHSIIKTDKTNLNDLEKLKCYCDAKNIKTEATIPSMSVHEVYSLLTQLKQTNTRGLDELDSKILKLSAPIISETLTYLYNLCIDKRQFPILLKQAKIIPIHKSGDKSDPSNYRPISILSVLSKPLEKHMIKHMLSHVNKYDLIHPNQSGFRQNHSCHTALTNLVDQWIMNINKDELTGVVFIDFAKAFDVLDHKLLLRKLELYKFSDALLSFIRSFFTNRSQVVSLNNKHSKFENQKFGVPQGSVVGPLFFSLYINDLPLHIESSYELFADDKSIHKSHSNHVHLLNRLQEDINRLDAWSELNHMSLNEKKTKYMIVTTRQKRQNLKGVTPPLFIQNKQIDEVQAHKLLGITLDNNLTWSSHIRTLCKTVSQKIFQLSKIKHFLDLESRKHFYYAHIQSCIDYASTLFDTCSANTLKPLSRLHKRAIKVILLKSSSPVFSDYNYLRILPLTNQFRLNKAVLMYRIMNDLAPPTLSARFQINQSRYTNSILITKPRIDLVKTSLLYSGGTLWNMMPESIKNKHSINTFREAYKNKLFYEISS